MEDNYAHVIAEFRGVAMTDPSEAIWQARATVARQRQTTVRRQQAVPSFGYPSSARLATTKL